MTGNSIFALPDLVFRRNRCDFLFGFFLLHMYGKLRRLDSDPVKVGIGPGKFRTKVQDSRCIVDPKQDDDQRTCCTVGRSSAGFFDIEDDKKPSDHKQYRRKPCARPDISPADLCVWQYFINDTEKNSYYKKADTDI